MQGSFVRKRGSTWTAYYYVPDAKGGRRQRSKGGFPSKAAARAYLTNKVNSVQTGEYVETIKLTFGDYLTGQWLPIMRRSIRPSTWDSYERMLKLHIIPRLGGVQLQNLTHQDLDDLYTDLLNTGRADGSGGLSPKTVRYIHNTVHKALKDAQRKQLIYRNVAESADPPRVGHSGSESMRTWTAEQVRTFLDGLSGHRLLAAYTLAATTGMRRGEVLGLRWRDVDFEARRLAVRQTVISINYKVTFGTPKTARGRRLIAVDASTVAALQTHRGQQDEEMAALGGAYQNLDLVFPKLDGTPTNPDFFSQCFDRTVTRLKLPRIRLHDLRHTHATLALSAGVSPKVISDRLGHATVAFTLDVYTHAIPQMQEDAADQIAELIFRANDEGNAKETPDQSA
jgi:integrase